MTDAGCCLGCLFLLVVAGLCLWGIVALFGDGGVGFLLGLVAGAILFSPAGGGKQSAGRVDKGAGSGG